MPYTYLPSAYSYNRGEQSINTDVGGNELSSQGHLPFVSPRSEELPLFKFYFLQSHGKTTDFT